MADVKLYYQRIIVGRAEVDPELSDVLSRFRWLIELPYSIRRQYRGRTDVILGLLREDPTLLPRCHPYLQLNPFILRLSRVVIRPQVIPLLSELLSHPERKDIICLELRSIVSDLRVCFLNRSRIDCRSSNLRELVADEDEDFPSDLPFGLDTKFFL